eukprot:m.86071 g.86071  ORF g.86071 m.86071 type:complete len:71 (+) comp14451_c0_seq1:444-656(+)
MPMQLLVKRHRQSWNAFRSIESSTEQILQQLQAEATGSILAFLQPVITPVGHDLSPLRNATREVQAGYTL